MSIINLLELEPTVISRDLRSKYLLIYGRPGIGKTTFAAQAPNNLILSFERGLNAISGVYKVDIRDWGQAKVLLRQLNKPEVKEKFHTITIDTVSIAYTLCEEYICNTQEEPVKSISEIPWGLGFSLLAKEFSSFLRQITTMDYGLILIAHAKTKNVAGPNDTVLESVSPDIPDRAKGIINALVDITGYIRLAFKPDGSSTRTLITRETPLIAAKSRWPYLQPEIPFGYDSLVQAIGEAVDRQEEVEGIKSRDKLKEQEFISSRPFEEAMEEGRTLWTQYVGQNPNPDRARKVLQLAETLFERPIRLSEVPKAEQPMFEYLLQEMRKLLKEEGSPPAPMSTPMDKLP